MKKILVTGGAGYIGSHTLVDLIENGFEVLSADNNVRSAPEMLIRVEKITGKKIKNYKTDLCNYNDTKKIFEEQLKKILSPAQVETWQKNIEARKNKLKTLKEKRELREN